MKRYKLGEFPTDYYPLTPVEQLAWHNPIRESYHSFHVERMGVDTYRWRDSRNSYYYIGTHDELSTALNTSLGLRIADPAYEAYNVAQLTILTPAEVDDLFSDL